MPDDLREFKRDKPLVSRIRRQVRWYEEDSREAVEDAACIQALMDPRLLVPLKLEVIRRIEYNPE